MPRNSINKCQNLETPFQKSVNKCQRLELSQKLNVGGQRLDEMSQSLGNVLQIMASHVHLRKTKQTAKECLLSHKLMEAIVLTRGKHRHIVVAL